MSPVPDPSRNQEGNPISNFSSSSENHGPMFMGPPGSSSEEENDFPDYGAYEPLAQNHDSAEEETEIDYDTLTGLMSALNTHGPTTIEVGSDSSFNENTSTEDRYGNEATSIAQTSEPLEKDDIETNVPLSHAQMLLEQAEKVRNQEFIKEQTSLWDSTSPANRIEIDERKEQEIKSVMSKITLPTSAIPAWASEMSDEEWKIQISSRIFGNIKTDQKDSDNKNDSDESER